VLLLYLKECQKNGNCLQENYYKKWFEERMKILKMLEEKDWMNHNMNSKNKKEKKHKF
jgi:hypothetical protein